MVRNMADLIGLPAATDQEIKIIKEALIEVADFPKPGIRFQDITPILALPDVFQTCIKMMKRRYQNANIGAICGLESRGFLFGCTLAYAMNIPFVPIRKPGKLPRKTVSFQYEKEYGTDEFHIHADALHEHENVVIVDDLIATGGTAEAAVHLVEKAGCCCYEIICVVELMDLKGRDKLSAPFYSIVKI